MDPKEILLHREPFLFVDEIVEIRYLEYSKGKKYVKDDEFWVNGHFPNDPIFPGVLLIETMAQIGGLLLKSKDDQKLNAYLLKVDNFKLIKKVVPGDEVVVEGLFLDSIANFTTVMTKAYVRGVKVAEGKITYVSKEKLGD